MTPAQQWEYFKSADIYTVRGSGQDLVNMGLFHCVLADRGWHGRQVRGRSAVSSPSCGGLMVALIRIRGIFLFIVLTSAIGYIFLFCLWIILGLFVAPTRVLPFGSLVFGIVSNAMSLVSSMQLKFDECFNELKRLIEETMDTVKDVQSTVEDALDEHAGLTSKGQEAHALSTADTSLQDPDNLTINVATAALESGKGQQLQGKAKAQAKVKAEAAAHQVASDVLASEQGQKLLQKKGQVDAKYKQAKAINDEFNEKKAQAEEVVENIIHHASEHDIRKFLSKVGINVETIIKMVIFATVTLVMVFVFLYMGMKVFADGKFA